MAKNESEYERLSRLIVKRLCKGTRYYEDDPLVNIIRDALMQRLTKADLVRLYELVSRNANLKGLNSNTVKKYRD